MRYSIIKIKKSDGTKQYQAVARLALFSIIKKRGVKRDTYDEAYKDLTNKNFKI